VRSGRREEEEKKKGKIRGFDLILICVFFLKMLGVNS
jgi:hypothetical protein